VRILIFGKNGQLGRELHRLVLPLGEVTALDLEDLNLYDLAALRQGIMELNPGVILNAAAYTAVDRAEQEPALAMQVNAHALRVMAETARKLKAALVHFSTESDQRLWRQQARWGTGGDGGAGGRAHLPYQLGL
jgi:dTDP-4-dehydrorhamnose reductase